jgi:hypothetical protein
MMANGLRVLALDIENSYIEAGVWSPWNVNLGIDQILEPGKMLCWSAQFIDEKKMHFHRHDDRDFLDKLWELMDGADAVLTYNGRKHDVPWINTTFLKAGYGPPSPFKHIDLLETAKKQFKFPMNKLQYLLTDLKLGTKLEHDGFPLWIKCLKKDPEAWKVMEKYNKQDVRELIKLYNLLLPWIPNHPNRSIYAQATVCPNCGSKHLQRRGTYKTQVGCYSRMQCQDCGAWSRTRYTELDKEVRKGIVVAAV